MLRMKTGRCLTDLACGEGEREYVGDGNSPVGNEVAWAAWIRLGGFDGDKREALVDLLDGQGPPCLPILIRLNPLHHRLQLSKLVGGAHGRGGGRCCATTWRLASCRLQFHPAVVCASRGFVRDRFFCSSIRWVGLKLTWHKQRWVERPCSCGSRHKSRWNIPPSEKATCVS